MNPLHSRELAKTYNQQALASSAQTLKILSANKEALKKNLPKKDIVLELAAHYETPKGNQVYNVAAIRLNNTVPGKLGVNITFYKHEQVFSRTKQHALPSTQHELSSIKTDTLVHNNYFRFIPSTNALSSMNYQNMCPAAAKVVDMFRQVFNKGVPLPRKAYLKELSFKIRTFDQNSKAIEFIHVTQGLESSNKWCTTGVINTSPDQRDYETHRNAFKFMVKAAQGNVMLPDGAYKSTIKDENDIPKLTDKD